MNTILPDRYPLTLDCRPLTKRLAETFDHNLYWHVDNSIKLLFREQVLKAFAQIPVDTVFVHNDAEPYATMEEMCFRIQYDGKFYVKHKGMHNNHILGPAHMFFRAAHDWFGHYCGKNPFTMDGELACYHMHAAGSQYSKETLPLVWSEVVLENSYRLYHGHWYRWYKPVYDPNFGKEEVK